MTTIEIASLPGFMLRKGKFGPPDSLWLTHQHVTHDPLSAVLEPGYFDQLISDASVHPLDHIKVVSTDGERVETMEILVVEKIANIDAANGVGSVTVQMVGTPAIAGLAALEGETVADDGKATIKWNLGKRAYEVIHNGAVVASFKDKVDAATKCGHLNAEREAA